MWPATRNTLQRETLNQQVRHSATQEPYQKQSMSISAFIQEHMEVKSWTCRQAAASCTSTAHYITWHPLSYESVLLASRHVLIWRHLQAEENVCINYQTRTLARATNDMSNCDHYQTLPAWAPIYHHLQRQKKTFASITALVHQQRQEMTCPIATL